MTVLDIDAKSGAVDHIVGIAEGLARQGADVTLFCRRSDQTEPDMELPFDVVAFSTDGKGLSRSIVRAARLSADAITNSGFDCVYLRNFSLDFPLFLSRLPEIPVFLEMNAIQHDEYSSRGKTLRGWLYGQFQRRTIKAVDAWLPTTGEVHQYARKAAAEEKPSLIAKNGVWVDRIPFMRNRDAVRREVGSSADTRVLVMAGYSRPWHGWDRAVRMMQYLDRRYELWLIGASDSKDYDAVTNLAKDEGVLNRVQVFPWMSEDKLAQLVSAADIGLGAVGLDRKNMTEIQALKIGLYLSVGVPALINCRDPRFTEELPFVKLAETTDEATLARFIETEFGDRAFDRQKCRDYATANLHWDSISRELLSFIESTMSSINSRSL